jgi:hypothetical protein
MIMLKLGQVTGSLAYPLLLHTSPGTHKQEIFILLSCLVALDKLLNIQQSGFGATDGGVAFVFIGNVL